MTVLVKEAHGIWKRTITKHGSLETELKKLLMHFPDLLSLFIFGTNSMFFAKILNERIDEVIYARFCGIWEETGLL